MCYFNQARWQCGYWKWTQFREQCHKEYRTGETCGLKLVYETEFHDANCKICDNIVKKENRRAKMYANIDRWQREGNRTATIEKTFRDLADVNIAIEKLQNDHYVRVAGFT